MNKEVRTLYVVDRYRPFLEQVLTSMRLQHLDRTFFESGRGRRARK